jgi:hypothetical protein
VEDFPSVRGTLREGAFGTCSFLKFQAETLRCSTFKTILQPVAHTYNPSYSGGRDQEDHGLKPAGANSSQGPILKIQNTKRAGGVVQVVERLPSMKP